MTNRVLRRGTPLALTLALSATLLLGACDSAAPDAGTAPDADAATALALTVQSQTKTARSVTAPAARRTPTS